MLPLPVFRHRKINANNRLHKHMKYQVIIGDKKMYFIMRQWCQEYFGQSIEYKYFSEYTEKLNISPIWSWDTHTDQGWKGHLYFHDDRELQLFSQKFQEMAKL